MNNINTKSYWDNRFSSGDWEDKKGRLQTTKFAEEQIRRIDLSIDFDGTILDFGCGLGDAMPIYRKRFPCAKLIGVDISSSGIEKCIQRYGDIASFIVGSHLNVPIVDIIITSNVFEHLSDNYKIAELLIQRCKHLYIVVPYKEHIDEISCNEHINSYDEHSFGALVPIETFIYFSKNTSYFYRIWNVWVKNIFRVILFRAIVRTGKQILFHFKGKL